MAKAEATPTVSPESVSLPVEAVCAMEATLANGMARVEAGQWLVGKGQPVAFAGARCQSQTLRGFLAPDRARLSLLTASDALYCASAERPFLTRLDCPMPLWVVSEKVLVAPASARTGAALQRLIPMSLRLALCVTAFRGAWVVTATRSRTTRVVLAEGETLTVRREAVVAWTTRAPTGFVPKLRLRDLLLPNARPKAMMVSFYGPGNLWIEGA